MTSNAATTTTFSSAIRTKWENKLLKVAEGYLVADRFAVSKVMGRGAGGTLQINRMLRPAKVTSATAEGSLITYSDASALTTNYITTVPAFWGDSFGITDKVDTVSFIMDEQNRKTIGNQMARSLDYQVIKTMSTGGLRHRIDKDSSYQTSGTVDSATSTTTTDDALDTLSSTTDDYFNGGRMTITNAEGPGYDETSLVTDFTGSGGVCTTSFTNTPTSSSKYRLTVGTGIVATDKLTTTGVLDVAALHEKLETEVFDGGLFRCFLHAAQHRDMWDDTLWKDSAVNDDSARFGNYRLVRWLDTEFLISSELYREDVDGTENQATGVVYVSPFFGANSYHVVRWGQGQGDFGVEFIHVNDPDSGNLRKSGRWISWKAQFGSTVLRATSMIGLMTGATSLNLVD